MDGGAKGAKFKYWLGAKKPPAQSCLMMAARMIEDTLCVTSMRGDKLRSGRSRRNAQRCREH